MELQQKEILINYLRLSKDIIDVAFDTSKYKINTLMPGSMIKN